MEWNGMEFVAKLSSQGKGMETLCLLHHHKLPLPSSSSSSSSSSVDSQRHKDAVANSPRSVAVIVKTMPRRMLLHFMGLTPVLSCVYPVFAAPMLDMNQPEVIRTLKLPSGVRIQEVVEGEGREATEGDVVKLNYVCRRANGYFVHSTVDQFSGASSPVILPLDENQIIKGLKEVLIGMKVGGKRRALIPPSVGYVREELQPVPEEFGPRRSLLSHANEPLVFEVQLLKIL